jgi:enterochelin esterase family protein
MEHGPENLNPESFRGSNLKSAGPCLIRGRKIWRSLSPAFQAQPPTSMKTLDLLPARIALFAAFALTAHSLIAAIANEPDGNRSPRLASLAHELQVGNREALAAFWQEIQGKAPLAESVGEDQSHRRVTFVWRATNETTRVTMMGGLPGANFLKLLTRLGDTDLWYLTETHSTEARFQYVFQINGPEALPMEMAAITRAMQQNPPRMDPFNPRAYAGWSYVELPDAPPQPWIKKGEVPSGRTTKEKFKTQILNAEYSLSIHTPPGYEQDRHRCWLMVAFDGGDETRDVSLDNLLAAGKIPPLVVIGVHNINSQTRLRDLNCSDKFASFLANELVPWARKTYLVYDDPAHTIVGGRSLGGKMATYCGLKHSAVFGKVFSHSGSFLTAAGEESPTTLWTGEAKGLLVTEFVRSPRLPLEFFIEVGRYETTLPFSHLLETRRLRDVLEAKGYRLTYSEYVGGHNEVCWRGSFADAVVALTTGRR